MDFPVTRIEPTRQRPHPGRHLSTRDVLLQASLPVLILAGGVAAFWLLSRWLRAEPSTVLSTATTPTVQVATTEAHDGGVLIEADGVVVPYREINLAVEVAGRVVERAEVCRAGNFVQRGTLLARIDPRDYELERDRLAAEQRQADIALDELAEEIVGAESLIELGEQQVALRGREFQRLQGLGRAVSTSDVDLAEVSELTARNALLTLRNQLRLMRIRQTRLRAAQELVATRLAKANLDLQRTEIVAPIDGVIVADHIEEDAFVAAGTTVVTIEDTSKVEVRCKLEVEHLFWLWDGHTSVPEDSASPGQAYAIPPSRVQVVYRLAGQGNREYVWDGQLARYDGLGLDEKTRTVPCRVVVDEPLRSTSAHRGGPPALVRGMYVTVRVQVTPRTPLLRVPEAAVQPGNVVYRVRGGELFIVPVQYVRLTPAVTAAGATLIQADDSADLTAGDQVVTSPLAFVRSGMEVEVLAPSAEEE